MALSTQALPPQLFRLGRARDAWEFPQWEAADPTTGTFGNRWDDPGSVFRVLYTSSSRLGCYLECLARFRPDSAVVGALAEIVENAEELPATATAGTLPGSWLATRRLGTAHFVGPAAAAIGTAHSLSVLNRDLTEVLIDLQLKEVDAAAIRLTVPRRFTQAVSRYVFDSVAEDGKLFAGIFYHSRLGDDIHCFALFEGEGRWTINDASSAVVAPDDADLVHALEMLAGHLEVAPGS